MKEIQKVMVFGTFDLLHQGHLSFLHQAKKLGTELIIVVARDQNVFNIKGLWPQWDETRRQEELRKLQWPQTKVFLGKEENFLAIIEEHQPTILALGYDQRPSQGILYQELKKRTIICEIVRLKPYKAHLYKSSKVRKKH